MPVQIHSKSLFLNLYVPFTNPTMRNPKPHSKSCKSLYFSFNLPKFRHAHVQLCAKNGVFNEFTDTFSPKRPEIEEEFSEELELHNKPSPREVVTNGETVEEIEVKKPDEDEVLEPFYKFFKPFDEENENENQGLGFRDETERGGNVGIDYYEPKQGDLVVGVVVSGNENKLDVNVGADLLGTMLTKEVLPLYDKELDYLLCDVDENPKEFMVKGKVGIVKNDVVFEKMAGKPVVEPGTVLFAEVLGRTLGGRPLLSTRRLFRKIAWHRVRQIKEINEPIEVKITEWNTGGLLTRIEGLRAFLPKAELLNRVNNFTEMKENVGRKVHVQITRINEDTNDLILSEKEGWAMMHLREGTLLEGTVRKIYPYGAQVRIGDTNRSGLLHISKITGERVSCVGEILKVGEVVKVLVVKSMFPDKIALSIADLESVPGLFLSNRERVFLEANEMARRYRKKNSPPRKMEANEGDLPFEDDEERLYANWKWFKFETHDNP